MSWYPALWTYSFRMCELSQVSPLQSLSFQTVIHQARGHFVQFLRLPHLKGPQKLTPQLWTEPPFTKHGPRRSPRTRPMLTLQSSSSLACKQPIQHAWVKVKTKWRTYLHLVFLFFFCNICVLMRHLHLDLGVFCTIHNFWKSLIRLWS